MFERLEIENFTVFERAEFEWSPGLNVLVGANGTGKTHVLKLLYCMQLFDPDSKSDAYRKLVGVFKTQDKFWASLMREGSKENTELSVAWRSKSLSFTIDSTTISFPYPDGGWQINQVPVYIPPKEVLSFAPGFISLYDKYDVAFEETYYDVIKHAYLPHQRTPDAILEPALSALEAIIGGQVTRQGEAFQLNGMTMHLVAEGHRKLALLWQLIRNGSIHPGNTLFWDEPEANLNPSLMNDLVKVLVMLAESGVQVFLATHNYAFLRELDFQRDNAPVRFFALEDTGDGVVPHAAERYRDIKPNKIAEEYQRLYDLEIKRSLGDA